HLAGQLVIAFPPMQLADLDGVENGDEIEGCQTVADSPQQMRWPPRPPERGPWSPARLSPTPRQEGERNDCATGKRGQCLYLSTAQSLSAGVATIQERPGDHR